MKRALAVIAVLLATTTACDAKDLPTPNAAKIDVDTPELVAAKKAAGVEDCVPGNGKRVTNGLPTVALPCLGGGPDVDLATLRGPMVVSLWAQWCGPCREEMPILQAFHERYGDRVGLVGIDYLDVLPDGALALMDETGATYPSLADPSGRLSAQAPFPVLRGLPYLAFVDADGVVTDVKPGAVKSLLELKDLVEQHLGVTL